MANALKFKNTDVNRQQGELVRLKVLQGPDIGAIYVVLSHSVTLGRGEENDIVISDLKASRSHAVLGQTAGGWAIQDAGSANGILHNGKQTHLAVLRPHDTFTLGGTTLEFLLSGEAGTQILKAPPRPGPAFLGQYSPFGQNQPDSVQKERKSILKNPLILAGLGGATFLLLFSDSGKNTKNTDTASQSRKSTDLGTGGTSNESSASNLAAYLPTSSLEKSAEPIFKEGMREYYLMNYARARGQFETVLQINPSHVLANIYLENCKKAIQDEIKSNLENGKKSYQAGKLREARGHFERVMRLLFQDQANPAYIESKDQLDKISKDINGGPGS